MRDSIEKSRKLVVLINNKSGHSAIARDNQGSVKENVCHCLFNHLISSHAKKTCKKKLFIFHDGNREHFAQTG